MSFRNYNPCSHSTKYLFLFCLISALWFIACSSSDSDYSNSNNPTEICNDGIDNDNDGLIDCEDDSCNSSSLCEEICNDGIDNDGDGFIDCADANCEDFQDCLIERCIDGVDNDGDGLVDCDDPDCDSNPSCE